MRTLKSVTMTQANNVASVDYEKIFRRKFTKIIKLKLKKKRKAEPLKKKIVCSTLVASRNVS